MERERFEELVVRALSDLPEEFRERLENIDIVVEDLPSTEQLLSTGTGHGQILLGLYEGVPHTRRNTYYGMVTPDKISVFQKNIEAKSRSETAIILEIAKVVQHEIAHHFGISDARLKEIRQGQD
jgi:predicted Zn-dependent protease with MMP-like domain